MLDKTDILRVLTQQGERMPALCRWLLDEIWSGKRSNTFNAVTYLEDGEREVRQVEELILATSPTVYDEIVAASRRAQRLDDVLKEHHTGVVVLDGASLRELPLLTKLAETTGYKVIECTFSYAALPSDTLYFVEQRVIDKRIAPSDLPNRQDLKEKGITAHYYDSPTRSITLPADGTPYLLWSRFPDGTYKDMGSKFSSHFGEIQQLYDTVWKNMILEIPNDYRIVITSDHGYAFFGPGLESNQSPLPAQLISQDRYKIFGEKEEMPHDVPGLQIIDDMRLAMLQGRIKNRPMGPSANNAYRHGGMSLMEMLTPWLVLERT